MEHRAVSEGIQEAGTDCVLGVLLQWVEVGDVDVDIGGNPSAEDAEEALESSAKKVVDLQDAFRLQEGPSYSKKELMTYLKARS